MPSAWNMFVKKIFEEGRKIHGKTYKFSQALKDASKRKAEMGVGAVKTVAKNVTKKSRGKRKSKRSIKGSKKKTKKRKSKKRKSKK